MAALITSADYPAVRAALDVSLSESELPDGVISQGIYAGAARSEVLERVPTAESETDVDTIERLSRAVIYLTAARLAPAVVRITSISITSGDRNYSRQTFDPTERAAQLRAMAEQELSEVEEPDEETPARPPMFALASGQRGR